MAQPSPVPSVTVRLRKLPENEALESRHTPTEPTEPSSRWAAAPARFRAITDPAGVHQSRFRLLPYPTDRKARRLQDYRVSWITVLGKNWVEQLFLLRSKFQICELSGFYSLQLSSKPANPASWNGAHAWHNRGDKNKNEWKKRKSEDVAPDTTSERIGSQHTSGLSDSGWHDNHTYVSIKYTTYTQNIPFNYVFETFLEVQLDCKTVRKIHMQQR